MPEYLKPRQEYVDRYDKHTVEKCRWWLNHDTEKAYIAKEAQTLKVSEEEVMRYVKLVGELAVHFYAGDRYIKKEETIGEWMRRDEARDILLETAPSPENITCLVCGRLMFVGTKHLTIGFDDDSDRVLFFYDCPLKHIPHRAFYNDGEEFSRKRTVCPKCGNEVIEEEKDTDAMWLTIVTCLKCGNVERREIERTANKPEQPDPDFEKDRGRFCLSEKEGLAFIQEKNRMEEFAKLSDKVKEKQRDKAIYDKVAKLKRLKIAELEQMLPPILEKEGYIKLQFKNPEIGKDVFVPFVAYDEKPYRSDWASSHDLEKLLKRMLQDTNWRLASDGTNYRLGMLEGRFHGYEKEDDLVNLIRLQHKKDTKKEA
jgi:hypothetical protein